MHILTVLVAAIGVVIVPALRRSPAIDDDDAVGLFIGSARPLAAAPELARNGRVGLAVAPRSGRS
jgi:hypothetical protein